MHLYSQTRTVVLSTTSGSNYLLRLFGGAGAAATRVPGFEHAGWGFLQATDHGLAAAQRRRTHLRVHRNDVRKAMHGRSRQHRSHGKAWGTEEINERLCKIFFF